MNAKTCTSSFRDTHKRNDIDALQSLLHASLPSLRPMPSICSLLRSTAVNSDVVLCRALFPTDNEISAMDAWRQLGESVPVCASCCEIVDEETTDSSASSDHHFYVSYKLRPKTLTIEVEGIRMMCGVCRKLTDMSQLMSLCTAALAAQAAMDAPVQLITALPLTQKGPQLTEETEALLRHFLEVNDLDPIKDAHKFQSSISLAFALLISTREHSWTLSTRKPTFVSLFSCT